jgi:hypothetical protein
MAVPSQPAHALDVGEVWRLAPAVPSPLPTDDGPHLGRVATSHINGRAGWWLQRSELTFQWVEVPSVEIAQSDTVVILGDGKGDRPIESPDVQVS